MGYQALLFCPDEKTARIVTQVLSELDFGVVPCSEPFGAVKKLMGERFDAVVVDCDNEQNATLLFKSARNAPNNQSALAVAVVEGQAGVAKAFRIGANLVLTKPINVEQAKGTLRVARGLLRKGEAAKAAAPAAAKPAAPAPVAAPIKPAPATPISSPRPVSAMGQSAPMNPAVTKPAPQPSFAASASSAITKAAESVESVASVTEPKIAPAAVVEPKAAVSSKLEVSAPPAGFAAPSGAASAPAPAREPKQDAPSVEKASVAIPEPENPVEEITSVTNDSSSESNAASAPMFNFGAASETESEKSGSNKVLYAILAIFLIAVAGYFAWNQWGSTKGGSGVQAPVAPRMQTPNGVQQTPQSAPAVAPAAPAASSPSSTTSMSPSSTSAPHTIGSANVSPTGATASHDDKLPVHTAEANSGDDASNLTSSGTANKASVKANVPQPILIKNGSSQPAAGNDSTVADTSAPSINAIASPDGGSSMPNLMGGANKAPAPVLQTVTISQGISQGLVVKKIPPAYPASALRMGIQGPVLLLATVSKTGDISAVKILSGDASLARAASDAVKQWKYKPYLLDGSPVEIQTQVTVNFKLPR
jgi:TonB family protein